MKHELIMNLVLLMEHSQKYAAQKMEQLLSTMEDAIHESNWYEVKSADKQLLAFYNELQNMPCFSSMKAEQNNLKARYVDLIDLVSQKQAAIKVQMQRHQEDKEGLIAYKKVQQGQSL
ncbi:MAG: hypothetical protein ACI9H9_000844 [Pseudoalteromonas tetraodonis]|mgnify:CR=1 FL=1|jgi:hypothetical protein|nr:hypothetical protein PUND_a2945 [Pseudoalteromonas undina]KPZ66350.1 hypothetical protein AN392_00370 [Pseudoalteromonas sp. P1-16-1b]